MIKLKTLLEMKDWSELTPKDMPRTNQRTRSTLMQLTDYLDQAVPYVMQQTPGRNEREVAIGIVNRTIRDLVAHSWAIPEEDIQKMVVRVVDEWFMRKSIRAKSQAP